MAELYLNQSRPVFGANGGIEAGAKAYFYLTGTTTKTPIYSDAALTTELTNPVVANAAGVFPSIYLDTDNVTYRAYLTDADGALLSDVDPYYPGDLNDQIGAQITAAQNSATAAAASATAAATSATDVTAKASQAQSFRDEAEGFKNDAESAALAAASAAGIQPDTTAGLAATTSGEFFTTPSADANGYLDLYLNSSGTAVFQKTYPSIEAVEQAINSGALVSGQSTRTVGVASPALAGPRLASGFTHGIIAPADRAQKLSEIEFAAHTSMTAVTFRVWAPQADGTYARSSAVTFSTITAGAVNTFTAPADFTALDVPEGGIVTWFPTGSGFYYNTSGSNTGVFFISGDPTTLAANTITGRQTDNVQVRLGFSDIPVYDATTLEELTESAAALVHETTTRRFGLPFGDTGVTGSATAANTIYAWNEPVDYSGAISEISGTASAAGDLTIWEMARDGGVLTRKRIAGIATVAGSGAFTLTQADFGEIKLSAGSYIGVAGTTNVLRLLTGVIGPHKGYSVLGSTGVFADGSPAVTNGALQVGISIAQQKPGPVLTTQGFHDALTADQRSNSKTIYGIPRQRLYIGGTEIVRDFEATTASAVWIGDSTSAEYQGETATIELITGLTGANLADPGDTIAQQLALWNALSNKGSYAAVVVQTGLNDVGQGRSASAIISDLQSFVNTIASGAPQADIVAVQMTPAQGQWAALFPGDNGAAAQAVWVAVNEAIAGNGGSPITGVDARVTSHVAELSGTGTHGSSYLNDTYKTDQIHPNTEGRRRVAVAVRAALTTLNHLPE